MHYSEKAPNWLNQLWKWESRLAEGLAAITTVMFFSVVTFIMIQVVCRYILKISCAWAEELARYVWMVTVMFGIAYVTHIDKHIDIDITHLFIKLGKTAKAKEVIAKICYIYRFFMIMLIGGFYSVLMIEYTKKIIKLGKYTPAAHVPQWIFIAGMTIGMVLTCVSCVSQVIYGFVGYDYQHEEVSHSELDEDYELGGTS